MHVAEYEWPGTWLDLPDDEKCRKAEGLVWLLDGQISEAAVALNMFDAEHEGGQSAAETRRLEEVELDALRASAVATGIAEDVVHVRLGDQLRLEARRRLWRRGFPPASYAHVRIFIHARAFVSAVDMSLKLLRALGDEAGCAAIVGEAAKLAAAIPNVKDVRDSVQHLDERGRGLAQNKPIKLQPVTGGPIEAPNGILSLGSLKGRRYFCTIRDGSLGEVQVDRATLDLVVEHVVRALDLLKWKGEPFRFPH